MMNSSITSIETKFCFKTSPNILNSIQLCKNCRQIPLPPYRHYSQSEIILCKQCYLSQYKNLDSNVISSKSEMKFMDQIIFSCKFSDRGCTEQFDSNTLQDLYYHQKKCIRNPNKNNFTRIKRLRTVNKSFKSKVEIIQNEINSQKLSFQENSKNLQNIINSQSNQIIELKRVIELFIQQKENDNQGFNDFCSFFSFFLSIVILFSKFQK